MRRVNPALIGDETSMRTELTPRETTVLHLVAWGYTNQQIAQRLARGVKTIETHKANGMRKLRAASRADVVRYALKKGWLEPGAMPKTDGVATPQMLAGSA
jgi:DNA-binding NarL/FixJ family response regulator